MVDRLTKRMVDAARAGQRETHLWDGEIKGFGLRVRPSGTKSFVFVYRPGGGRVAPKRRVTIDAYGNITLEQARRKAQKLAGDVAHNRDPAREIKAARHAKADAAASTIGVLVPRFVEQHHRARGNRWAAEAERTLTVDAVRKWRGRSVGEITAPDIAKLLREVATGREAPVQARKLYTALSRFLKWCVAEGYCSGSPMAGVEAPSPGEARDRVISDGEIALMWKAADELGYPYGPCVQLLILTGARRNEMARVERPEFDLGAGTWLLPAARSKNKRPHLRHLHPRSVEIIAELPRFARRGSRRRPELANAPAPERDYVFTSNGDTPVNGFSKVRDRLQAAMVAEGKRQGVAPPVDDWTFHDLRRSLVTWLAGAGFAVHVADKLLGHSTGAIQGVAAVYQRNEFLPERKAAMLAWSDHVLAVARGIAEGGNVVRLRAAAKDGAA